MRDLQKRNKEVCDEFYLPRIAQFDGVQAMGWGSMEGQVIRHNRIFQYIDTASSLLDVGCGDGYSAQFCKGTYLGIDNIPAMIERAKLANPTCDFRVCSIDEVKDTFEWVIGIGIFAFLFDRYFEYFLDTIKSMFTRCSVGVAFNIPNNCMEPSRLYKLVRCISYLYNIRVYSVETYVHLFKREV